MNLDSLMSEKEFQAQVVQAARMLRWMVSHMTLPQRSEPGVPDLLLVRPPRVIFAELKSEKGRLDTRRRAKSTACYQNLVPRGDSPPPNRFRGAQRPTAS